MSKSTWTSILRSVSLLNRPYSCNVYHRVVKDECGQLTIPRIDSNISLSLVATFFPPSGEVEDALPVTEHIQIIPRLSYGHRRG